MCGTRVIEYRLRRPISIDRWAVIVGLDFHCDVISCELARQDVRRGVRPSPAAATVSSACGV